MTIQLFRNDENKISYSRNANYTYLNFIQLNYMMYLIFDKKCLSTTLKI